MSILSGQVKLFAANNSAFLNSIFNSKAATANEVSTSNPTGISLNNAFGRPWFANAPFGDGGFGTIAVIDPGGMPFKGAPDLTAGGVFAGTVTNRNSSSQHGLVAPALGTSLATKSPDHSGRAVFFAVLSDGSIEQVHVSLGTDLLAPPNTIGAISGVGTAAALSTDANDINRVGIVFNWVPSRILYVADPLRNQIVALSLSDDGTLFTVTEVGYLSSGKMNIPVDIAPAMIEGAERNFASNTTLGGGSDLYVLNRGDNTILRMTQKGRVVAIRSLDEAVEGLRVAGLATSDDGRTLYVTGTTPGGGGVVLSTPAFGQSSATESLLSDLAAANANGLAPQGVFLFSHDHTVSEGVGPLFNGQACGSCHNSLIAGGMGVGPGTFATRVAKDTNRTQKDVHGGPIVRVHSITELGAKCDAPTGVPPDANVESKRSAFTLRGSSKIDNVLDFAILANQANEPAAIRGKANTGPDGRIGHFGWKAQIPTLIEFIGDAMTKEMGVTNPLVPKDEISACHANDRDLRVDAIEPSSIAAFLESIDPPVPSQTCLTSSGATLFANVGCAGCHTPSLPGPGSPTSAELPVQLYSDLLVHDMGPGLDDGIIQGQAGTSEFRTAPLWRVSDRSHFLHDGRASTITDAIKAHGGQAATAEAAFEGLSSSDQQSLLDFLNCI